MTIKKISVSNFKSFNNLEIELGDLNVLIGANASGKSNFLQIFKFLKDITNYGLNNAISLQGGIEYFRNTSLGASKNFSLKVVYDPKAGIGVEIEKRLIGIKAYETVYEFTIEFSKTEDRFVVCQDTLTQKYEFVELERQKEEIKEKGKLGVGEIIFININGEIKDDVNLPKGVPRSIFPSFLGEGEKINLSSGPFSGEREKIKLSPKTLLLETPVPSLADSLFSFTHSLKTFFDSISMYDFDPRLPKKAISITGKTELEGDGSNLAIVLKNILEDKRKKRKFSNLIKDILPFVDDLRVEKFADKSLIFALQEIYTQKFYLPASFISDGTISITALIIALYFEQKPLIILEEPERNIHPFLISKVVQMLEEASTQKQIIVTTHNPEVIKYTNIENVLLISRDDNGFSTISRPSEKEEVKIFLENEIGIEELYIQNLLGV